MQANLGVSPSWNIFGWWWAPLKPKKPKVKLATKTIHNHMWSVSVNVAPLRAYMRSRGRNGITMSGLSAPSFLEIMLPNLQDKGNSINHTHFNAFKYYVSCTDGKFSVGIIYFYYLFFHHRPTHKLCFLSCRPFVVNIILSFFSSSSSSGLFLCLKKPYFTSIASHWFNHSFS